MQPAAGAAVWRRQYAITGMDPPPDADAQSAALKLGRIRPLRPMWLRTFTAARFRNANARATGLLHHSRLRVRHRLHMSGAGQPIPLVAVLAFDRPDARELRRANRTAHLEWATQQPWIRLGGPLSDTSATEREKEKVIGSFLGLQTGFVEHLKQDPYTQVGLFERSERYVWRVSVGSLASFPPDAVELSPRHQDRFYLIWGVDKPGALERRLAQREKHLAWLRASETRCVIAGAVFEEAPPSGDAASASKPRGTILIVRGFNDVHELRSWLAGDPYQESNVFEHIHIFGFQPIICRVDSNSP